MTMVDVQQAEALVDLVIERTDKMQSGTAVFALARMTALLFNQISRSPNNHRAMLDRYCELVEELLAEIGGTDA